MEAILQLEVVGNQLWRILALFGVILVSFLSIEFFLDTQEKGNQLDKG